MRVNYDDDSDDEGEEPSEPSPSTEAEAADGAADGGAKLLAKGSPSESFRRQAAFELAGRGVVVPQRLRLHDQPAELDARPQKPLPRRSEKIRVPPCRRRRR